MKRRDLLIASVALAAAPRASQARKQLPVLGILNPHRRPPPDGLAKSPLRARLRELGWIDGKTILFDDPDGEGREDRMPELAARLVARNVDVIWALGAEATIAAARATTTIPIVFWAMSYPVERGLIKSLAHPGGNVTGVAWHATPEVETKRLELLREIAPTGTRLAHLRTSTSYQKVAGGEVDVTQLLVPAAKALAYELREFLVATAADLDPAFAAILDWGAHALSVAGTTLTARESKRVVDLANHNRLPSTYTLPDFVEAGGLVSYAIDWRPTFAQTADYVDRILRGSKPSELPVELPSRYVTAVNLKTAKMLGLKVPQSILIRADRVIE